MAAQTRAGLAPRAQAVFFHDHISDLDQLSAPLAAFEVVMLVRERTAMGADLIGRLPKLKLIVTVGMWNVAIDFAATKARGIAVCRTRRRGVPMPALTPGLGLAVTRGIAEQAAVSTAERPRRCSPAFR